MSPSRRRRGAEALQRRFEVSERRACLTTKQWRSTQRYQVRSPQEMQRLLERLEALTQVYPRYGYRRVWALLQSEGFRLNVKRVYRLWRKA